jgi:hypothetical protein
MFDSCPSSVSLAFRVTVLFLSFVLALWIEKYQIGVRRE